jgi:hypothetical protein
MNKDKIIIADPQIHKGSSIEHLEAVGKYIWRHKPEEIVHIGDHWDFPSLSSYASPLEREGKRLKEDLNAGIKALKAITKPVVSRQKRGTTEYDPEWHFITGNHEDRLTRFISQNPALAGFIDLEHIIESLGWIYHPFKMPYFSDDIAFVHYMTNPQSGKPVGGSIENKLNKFPHSFVHGHQQQYQYGRRQNLQGKPHFGVCAGSFYIEDEGYRGADNTEIRGFVHLHAFTNRYGFQDYDVEFVSLERLLAEY